MIKFRVFFFYLILFIGCFTAQLCDLDQAYFQQIQLSLDPFRINGITPEIIAKAKQMKYVCIVTIKNGKSYFGPNCKTQCLEHVYDSMQLPDMEFVLNNADQPRVLKHRCNKAAHWTDSCYCDPGYVKPDHGFFLYPTLWDVSDQLIPIFSAGILPQCFSDILVPNMWLYRQNPEETPLIPWEDKQFKAIFRGSTTVGDLNQDIHFTRFHRHRLVDLCRDIEDCDAMFHSYYQPRPQRIQQMKDHYGPTSFISLHRQAEFKLNIDIDGFTYAQRFASVMSLGSAVIKITAFKDVALVAAKPWEHYIPVDLSLSDFKSRLKWAKENDQEVKAIAERGVNLAKRLYKAENFICYMHILLLEYHKLMRPALQV